MIYEYAISPTLAIFWAMDRKEYRYFYEQFGLGQSRIMSEFPKFRNWRRQFWKAAAGAKDFEQQRLTAIFGLLTERLVRRDGFTYDGNISWLQNAEPENERFPFHAILASDNPRHYRKVITPSAIETSPLWRNSKQDYCPRTAREMAQLVSAMISNCSKMYFIDPHFGPENVRYRRPLEAFLKRVAINRYGRSAPKCIEIHTSDKAEAGFFKETCQERLPGIVPTGLCIKMKRWREVPDGEKLHERFILTDIGGVKVGPGLDEGSASENFEVMLLERNMFVKQWNDYVDKPAFDLAEDPIIIIGNA